MKLLSRKVLPLLLVLSLVFSMMVPSVVHAEETSSSVAAENFSFSQEDVITETEVTLGDEDFLPQNKEVVFYADVTSEDAELNLQGLTLKLEFRNDVQTHETSGCEMYYSEELGRFTGTFNVNYLSKEGTYVLEQVYYDAEEGQTSVSFEEPLNIKVTKTHTDVVSPVITDFHYEANETVLESGSAVDAETIRAYVTVCEAAITGTDANGINFVHFILTSSDGNSYNTTDFVRTEEVTDGSGYSVVLYHDIPVGSLSEGEWAVEHLYVTDLYDNATVPEDYESLPIFVVGADVEVEEPETDVPETEENTENYVHSSTALTVGEAVYAIADSYDYTIFEFSPEETGVYNFTTDGLIGIVSNNGMWITIDPTTETVAEQTLSWECTGVGQTIWVAVSSDTSEATIAIERTESEQVTIDRIEYTNIIVPSDLASEDGAFVFEGQAENLVAVNTKDGVTTEIVLGEDEVYHLQTEDGPILYLDFSDSRMNLSAANSYGQLRGVQTEDGEIVAYIDFTAAVTEYLEVADSETVSGKILFPLTEDLRIVLESVGNNPNNSWYAEDSAFDLGTDEDTWMFSCYYLKEPSEAEGISIQNISFSLEEAVTESAVTLGNEDYLPLNQTVTLYADVLSSDYDILEMMFHAMFINEEAGWSTGCEFVYDEELGKFVGTVPFDMISKEGTYLLSKIYYMENEEEVLLEVPENIQIEFQKEHTDSQGPEVLDMYFAAGSQSLEPGTVVSNQDSIQFVIKFMEELADDEGKAGINFLHMRITSEDSAQEFEFQTGDFQASESYVAGTYFGVWTLELPMEDIPEGTWKVSYFYATDLYDNSTSLGDWECTIEVVGEEVDEHNYVAVVTEPTCKEKGYTTYTCDHCGDSYVDNYVDMVDHEYMEVVVEPTCTKRGYTAHMCRYCDEAEVFDYTAARGHTYGTWTVIKKATCTETGEKVSVCKVCDVAASQTIVKKGHSHTAVVTKPTCTKKGYTTHTCTRCSDTYVDTYVSAKGHTYSSWKITKKATCSATGTKVRTCSVCSQKQTSTINKIAHTYGSWKITKRATLLAAGTRTKTCTVCSAKQTQTIARIKSVSLAKAKYTYTGNKIAPTVTVKDYNGNTLKKGTDYTVKYSDGRKATGKYTVTVTFTGKYKGEKKLTFYILPASTSKTTVTKGASSLKAAWIKVTGATGYRVQLLNTSGKVLKTVHTTKLTTTFSGLTKGTTYKIKVTAYKTIGDTKYYSLSSRTVASTLKPAVPTLKAVAGTKKVTLTWNKVKGSGYEILYATNSKFSSAKKIKVNDIETVKRIALNLKTGTTYYFKIRSYVTVGDTKIYSDYSKYVKAKAK